MHLLPAEPRLSCSTSMYSRFGPHVTLFPRSCNGSDRQGMHMLGIIVIVVFLIWRQYRSSLHISTYTPSRVVDAHILRAFCTRIYNQLTASLTPVLLVNYSASCCSSSSHPALHLLHNDQRERQSPLQRRNTHHIQTRHPLFLRPTIVPAHPSSPSLSFPFPSRTTGGGVMGSGRRAGMVRVGAVPRLEPLSYFCYAEGLGRVLFIREEEEGEVEQSRGVEDFVYYKLSAASLVPAPSPKGAEEKEKEWEKGDPPNTSHVSDNLA